MRCTGRTGSVALAVTIGAAIAPCLVSVQRPLSFRDLMLCGRWVFIQAVSHSSQAIR